jgi:hypothetical protein
MKVINMIWEVIRFALRSIGRWRPVARVWTIV